MRRIVTSTVFASLWLCSAVVAAQERPAPQNVVQLSAGSTLEVAQDWLAITMSTTREGADPAVLQTELKSALEAALAVARSNARPGSLEVRTGNFALFPRYGDKARVMSWQGSVELVLEGRDFPRITATAGKIETLTMANVAMSLSRRERERLESQLQSQAIERFRAKAAEIARAFGFTAYTVREVSVSALDQGGRPEPRFLAAPGRAPALQGAPVPVEAGKTEIGISVSGSVVLK